MGSINGQSGFFHGCDVLQMVQNHGEFDRKTSMPLVCEREALLGKGGQMLNLINNAVVVSSAYMGLNEKAFPE